MLDQDERRTLGLLLDCEYLIAEIYVRAQQGAGLSSEQRGQGAGAVKGGRAIEFLNVSVGAFVREAARDAISHVTALRQHLADLGERPYRASSIDLETSFADVLQGAALMRSNQSFDAFANEANLMLAVYIIEEVIMTACANALAHQGSRELLIGLFGSISSRAAIVRTFLFAMGLADETNAISCFRQVSCGLVTTAFQGNDHGVGTFAAPSMMPLSSNGMAWARSPEQCAAILTGHADGSPGRFFPNGINAVNAVASHCLELTRLHLSHIAQLSSESGIQELASFEPEVVAMSPLDCEFTAYQIIENTPIQPWTQVTFTSCTPLCIEIKDAIVHANVGIIGVGSNVIEETLWHTDPRRHRYELSNGFASLDIGTFEILDKTTVSILVGAAESYWHTIIDSVARLILIPDACWSNVKRVLYPSTGIQVANLLKMWNLPSDVELREVTPAESFVAETLIFPSSLHGLFDYHPTLLKAAFARLVSNVDLQIATPRLIYIDRRQSPLRKLVNENELIAALPEFTAVRLESLTATDQARLFANADVIVAPHGAGLTNIGFCRPGTVVIELMMDAYCNWCYRRMAAINALSYICILGYCLDYQEPMLHSRKWKVEMPEFKSAIQKAKMLARA